MLMIRITRGFDVGLPTGSLVVNIHCPLMHISNILLRNKIKCNVFIFNKSICIIVVVLLVLTVVILVVVLVILFN